MMKKILAVAIASAFAAPAFAATANVDVYGQFRGSVDYVDSDDTSARTRVTSNNSRLGFKGTEDLGNGLSAIWQWEYAFQLDRQADGSTFQGNNESRGSNSSRHTFVGLSSKTLGSLTFGTQESPLKTSTGPLAVFGDTLGDYRSVFTRLSTRSDNSVLYTSPKMMGGLTVRAMYGARNEAGAVVSDDSVMYAVSGVYSNGPLYATLAYETNEDVINTNNLVGNAKNDAWRAGIGYTFGNTKLGLAYENNDIENGAGVTVNDGNAWYVSVAHKMGNITLAAAYADREQTGNNVVQTGDAKQWTVGATYSLSKRTSLYALYTDLSNGSGGTAFIGQSTGVATVGSATDGDASGFSLGMNHSF